ncbi:MAG TPA: molybdopterin-dependent oxidoreductase [Myxococcota bacterium]|nr:molybdopterin-dependent oxidoreductase [Myxococcota bacterium]
MPPAASTPGSPRASRPVPTSRSGDGRHGETREVLSFCRQCMGMCGTVVTLDAEDRVVGVRGDPQDPNTLGYACFKGINAPEAHNGATRIRHPLKRMPDGTHEPIALETALDEIATKMRAVLDAHGPEAFGGYRGGGAFFNSSSVMMLPAFLEALGSHKAYSSVTIDQSAKVVAAGRLGAWPPGRVPFSRGDVFLLIGGNPLVSVSANGFDTRNPSKRLKAARARGMKLVVIDPRRTETARHADVHLQPLPGEDCTILAGMLHLVLEQGWQDRGFCERYADDVEALRRAVAGFTPEVVARRADVPVEDLLRATTLFAKECRTGAAAGATGPDMSPFGNLAEHLIECLNIVCGRYLREGDEIEHPGAIQPRMPRRAEVVPPMRTWEQGPHSRVGGFGPIAGEMPTGTLVDEILAPGPGRIRCFVTHGGNPASAIPETERVVRAFESLELHVAIEPFMTMTAQLADYVLPPKLQYEREDLPAWLYESFISPEPYTRYTRAIARPPRDAEVHDDHFYFWEIARRMGLELRLFGEPLDMSRAPTTRALLERTTRDSAVSLAEIERAERGLMVEPERQLVEPGDPASPHRFALLPADVARELAAVEARLDEPSSADAHFPYRLAVRRLRDANNSAGLGLPSIKARVPWNPVFMSPDDMLLEGLTEGDEVEVVSRNGAVRARVRPDPDLRRGVVSLTHGFGDLPRKRAKYEDVGANANELLSLDDAARESINAMPHMTGIPVAIRASDRDEGL